MGISHDNIKIIIEEIKSSKFTIIAARPGMGKTALALNIAHYLAYSEPASVIAYFTLEMTTKQILERLFSFITNTDYKSVKNTNFSIHELQKPICSNLIIDDTSGFDLPTLKNILTSMKGMSLKYIFIDYLQLMDSDKNRNRQKQIDEILVSLKTISEQYDISIILLSQLNRVIEQRPDKRPKITDLQYLTALETNVNKIVFLYRDDAYTKKSCLALRHAELSFVGVETKSKMTEMVSFCPETLSFVGF